MSDLSATQCGRNGLFNFGNGGSGCSCIIIILLLLCCCGGNSFGNDCGSGCDCIWIILLLCCCCGNGNNNGCGCDCGCCQGIQLIRQPHQTLQSPGNKLLRTDTSTCVEAPEPIPFYAFYVSVLIFSLFSYILLTQIAVSHLSGTAAIWEGSQCFADHFHIRWIYLFRTTACL